MRLSSRPSLGRARDRVGYGREAALTEAISVGLLAAKCKGPSSCLRHLPAQAVAGRDFPRYPKDMAPGSDHYATLDVRPNVSGAALRQAYHKLMRQHHPDVSDSADSAERCQAINEAYACLRDPRRRALYDARRRAHQRARRSAFSPDAHGYRPTGWNPTNVEAVDFGEGFENRRSRILRVVGAVLLTIATFWATTWIELPGPPQAGTEQR